MFRPISARIDSVFRHTSCTPARVNELRYSQSEVPGSLMPDQHSGTRITGDRQYGIKHLPLENARTEAC